MSFIRSPERQLRLKYSRSLAYDITINRRNLEDAWYQMWNCVLTELIEDRPNLHVAPQCTLWVEKIRPPPSHAPTSDEEGAQEPPQSQRSLPKRSTVISLLQNSTRNTRNSQRVRDESSGITEEDIQRAGKPALKSVHKKTTPNVLHDASANTLAAPAPQNLSGDTSRHDGPRGSNVTVAAPEALERIPDFAIFHTQVEQKNTEKSKPIYHGFKVKMLSIPIIVEIKPFVSRRLVGQEQLAAIKDVIENTYDQIYEQAGLLFLEFRDVNSVHGIVACGPYWATAEITREHIPPLTWSKLKNAIDPDHPYEPLRGDEPEECQWLPFVEIESAISNQRLESLRSFLATFPVDDAEQILGDNPHEGE